MCRICLRKRALQGEVTGFDQVVLVALPRPRVRQGLGAVQ